MKINKTNQLLTCKSTTRSNKIFDGHDCWM